MLLTVLLAITIAPAASGCSFEEYSAGVCTTVENTGSSVEIGGTRPGGTDQGGPDQGGPDREGSTRDGGTTQKPPEAPCAATDIACSRKNITYSVSVLKPTLNDIASFAPAPLALVDEPGSVGIAGMPLNFVIQVRTHEQTGTLFGLPVTVRFTPASVTFRYGDGTSRDANSGGSTWAELGLAQFSPTPTSHAYSARGTYTVSAVVHYTAAANFGNGWLTVPGLVDIPTPASSIQILEARTALVDQTCVENPAGIGC